MCCSGDICFWISLRPLSDLRHRSEERALPIKISSRQTGSKLRDNAQGIFRPKLLFLSHLNNYRPDPPQMPTIKAGDRSFGA